MEKYIKLTYRNGMGDGCWAIYKKREDGVYCYNICSKGNETTENGYRQYYRPSWPMHWDRRKIFADIDIEHISKEDIQGIQFLDCL